MSTLEGLIFGLLQGITEFLPVSSSAHLKLVKLLFGIESSESQVVFDLICHLGTLVAVLLFFRKDLVQLFTKDRKQLGLLFLATLPLIPCYLLLKPLRDFASAPQYLGICLMITSLILFIGNKWRVQRATTAPSTKKISDILMIGTMQSAALIPGISRSASTISCARVLGWSPSEAVRFSFLLSIPTIIGGNCLEALKLYVSTEAPIEVSISACIAAFAASCTVGLFMVRFAISILEKGNLKPFAWYCLVLGLVTTLFLCVV
ncbi:MAG: undecaprenyl-diphosphate phosphatase [Verrucomicrobia bacterium]|nr:undecaprenyl-diphosphate phosphatase [Verrucomicrobiota bacterium]